MEDLGDAFELLKNNSYLGNAALKLIQKGVLEMEPTWGGWLGQYQAAIGKHLSKARDRESARRGIAR